MIKERIQLKKDYLWYLDDMLNEYLVFEEIDKSSVRAITVKTYYKNQSAKRLNKNTELIISYDIEKMNKAMMSYQYGFNKKTNSMYIFECVSVQRIDELGYFDLRYTLRSIVRFRKNSKVIEKMDMLGAEGMSRETFLNNINEQTIRMVGEESMSLTKLTNKECQMEIIFSNMKIDYEKISKISEAWNVNYNIAISYIGRELSDVGIRIYATNKDVPVSDYNVKKEWLSIVKLLKNNEIPEQFVLGALENINNMEE